MECRPVEIKLISASGIKDVNTLSKMDVYVVVSVSGDPRSIQRSPIDKDGGIHPRWHHYEMNFVVDEAAAQNSRIGFVFQIMSNRTLGDKEAGRVYIPVKELLDRYDAAASCSGDADHRPHKEVEYQVQTPSGKLKGNFRFSYSIGEKFTKKTPLDDPMLPMAYPLGAGFVPAVCSPLSSPGGYPVAVPYAAPAPAAFPYAQPAGYDPYVYPETAAAPGDGRSSNAGNKFGVTAAGVGLGLLGGMLIGEMVDDMAEAAYDL